MASSVPIDRQWIFILQDGTPVLDLGEDLVQDLLSGDFVSPLKNQYSHPIQDDELEMLRRAGRVEKFNTRQVFVYALPEPPRRTIE
ncbi:MAG TPA: hypothetical protein VI755_16205 [Anaerolineales bacterium]|jgi:hypothetical protein|nr:hypothetical protein [Anaerolineales bacterium]